MNEKMNEDIKYENEPVKAETYNNNPPKHIKVTLDDNNSDINFVVEKNGLAGSSLHTDGFNCLWAGVRATHGVSTGKVCYEVVIQEQLEVEISEFQTLIHVVRVGWSVDSPDLTLGESGISYGYGGTGKMSHNNKFLNYGEPFSSNDVIMCYIDLDAVPKTISFAKNGQNLGVAFKLGPETKNKIFYPHISVKNMRFEVNFGSVQPHFPMIQDFNLIENIDQSLLRMPYSSFKKPSDCEVLMMVGLPSCGKTTWAEQFVKDHPQKKYYLLGTNDILCKMKVMGLSRKRNYHGRWDALITQATGILNEMLKICQRKCRNYILDQTNVYPNARRRKMKSFRNYRHIAVVIVNDNVVLAERRERVVREEGKEIPESAVMEMKANFKLPGDDKVFDEVWYVEESRENAEMLVRGFNEEGRAWREEQKKRALDAVPSNSEDDLDAKRVRDETSAYYEDSQYEEPDEQQGSQSPRSNNGDHFDSQDNRGQRNNSKYHERNAQRGRYQHPRNRRRPQTHVDRSRSGNDYHKRNNFRGRSFERSHYNNDGGYDRYPRDKYQQHRHGGNRNTNDGMYQRNNYEPLHPPNYAQPQFASPYQTNPGYHNNTYDDFKFNMPVGAEASYGRLPYQESQNPPSYPDTYTGFQGYQPAYQMNQPGYQPNWPHTAGFQQQNYPQYNYPQPNQQINNYQPGGNPGN